MYLIFLFLVLIVKTLLVGWVILHGGIGLGPDEAQYWTWSQFLDWGYYSKPPGIAWEIWLGTHLFGNTELGVRSIPLLLGCAIPLAVYTGAKSCRLSPSICFWAAICMALTPLGILASFLAITDGGMVLFWTLACAYLAKQIEDEQTPSYLWVGLLIFCGALFKWPIYFLWVLILGSWNFFRPLISRQIVWGILISLCALLPTLYWNATHEWSTFKHVATTLGGGHGGQASSGNFWEFFGAQAALVSPILFVLLLITFWRIINKSLIPKSIFFCGGVSFILLTIGCVNALFMKMQGNWAIFAYPTSFIALAWMASQWKKWMIAGVTLSVVLCACLFSLPYLQSHNSIVYVPYKMSPFKHNVGWENLSGILKKAGYQPDQDVLVSDKYQTTSILSFYGPEQKRAYFLNLQGSRKNQFSFWPGIEKGKRAFFVVIENTPHFENSIIDKHKLQLTPYFKEVKSLGVHPLFFAYDQMVKGALLFECTGYNGELPPETMLY